MWQVSFGGVVKMKNFAKNKNSEWNRSRIWQLSFQSFKKIGDWEP